MLPPGNIATQLILKAGRLGTFHFSLSAKIGRREIDGVMRKDASNPTMAGLKEISVDHSCKDPRPEGGRKAHLVRRTPGESEENAAVVCACQVSPIEIPATVTTWASFYDWMLVWGNEEGRKAEAFAPKGW